MRDHLSKMLPYVSRILGIRFLYGLLVQPRMETEDARRKEWVLNILLVSTIILMVVLGISMAISHANFPNSYSGIPPWQFIGIFVFFCALLALSRMKHVKIASATLVALYFTVTLLCVYQWTFLLPMIILAAILTITISSILIGTRFSFLLTGLMSVCIIIITTMQIKGVVPLNLYWMHEGIIVQDVVEICSIFFLISGISWLSNRETEKSLARARASEASLLVERNLLEIKVEERTRELKEIQQDQIGQLAQLAEVGKTASGVFHDLMNPLNNVVASVETLARTSADVSETADQVHKAVKASRRMGDLIGTIQKQIKPSHEILEFIPFVAY